MPDLLTFVVNLSTCKPLVSSLQHIHTFSDDRQLFFFYPYFGICKRRAQSKGKKSHYYFFLPRNYLEDILARDKGTPQTFCARRDLSDWFIGTWKAELAGRIWWRNGHTIWAFSKNEWDKKLCDWLIKTSPVDQLLELLLSPSPATVLCQIYF